MVLSAARAGVLNSSDNDLPNTIVALASAGVGHRDLATAEPLPGRREGDDIVRVL